MKQLIIVLITGAALYQGWQYFQQHDVAAKPAFAEPGIAVYGRDSCGWTKRMRSELEQQGIAFDYRVIDQRDIADALHQNMRAAGLDTRRYNLPVVAVNGQLLIRPELKTVLRIYDGR